MSRFLQPYAERWPQWPDYQHIPVYGQTGTRALLERAKEQVPPQPQTMPNFRPPEDAHHVPQWVEPNELFASIGHGHGQGMQAQRDPRDYMPQPMGVGGPMPAPAPQQAYNQPQASQGAPSNYPPSPKFQKRGPGPIEFGNDGNVSWKNGDQQQVWNQR
jgi:hypothetical protein